MNRRKFLKSLMVGTAGIAAAPLMVRASFIGVDYGSDFDQSINMILEHSNDGIHFRKINPGGELTRYIRLNFSFQ